MREDRSERVESVWTIFRAPWKDHRNRVYLEASGYLSTERRLQSELSLEIQYFILITSRILTNKLERRGGNEEGKIRNNCTRGCK